MSSTCDHGVLRPAHKARNMPKHFFITCQIEFHSVSVQASLLLYVTRSETALVFDSDEQIVHTINWNRSDVALLWTHCTTQQWCFFFFNYVANRGLISFIYGSFVDWHLNLFCNIADDSKHTVDKKLKHKLKLRECPHICFIYLHSNIQTKLMSTW